MVLPAAYYSILALELVGLIALARARPFRAGDPLGHAIGWIGTGSMVLMHVYSIRRRVRALSRWGALRTWLHLHIFLGLQGALLVTFHSLHLTTVGNISGITIAMTLVVVASGLFGRYLFSLLPKGVSGERLSAVEIEREIDERRTEVAARLEAHGDPRWGDVFAPRGEGNARLRLAQLVREDLRARRAVRELAALVDGKDEAGRALLAAVRRRALLERRLATLGTAERLFRNWTILHKPLTFVLLGAVLLHVFAHYLFAAQFSG